MFGDLLPGVKARKCALSLQGQLTDASAQTLIGKKWVRRLFALTYDMTLCPVPSPSHADPTLQPSYFTSSLYTEALRQDISHFVASFHEQYTAKDSEAPFAIFKRVWRAQRWHLLHFKVFDDRARQRFLSVTCRLFLEKAKKQEPLFTRVAALLSLYTFYATQPLNTTPSLWNLKHIPVPVDQFHDLRNLEADLAQSDLLNLSRTVNHVLRYFQETDVFVFLPDSKLCPEYPRALPREIYINQGLIASFGRAAQKKKGRPSKNDKTRKAQSTRDSLENWLAKTGDLVNASPSSAPTSKVDDYKLSKTHLLGAIGSLDPEGHDAIVSANQLVLQRLKDVREMIPQEQVADGPSNVGISRVEQAMTDLEKGLNSGILDLLEGSGMRGERVS